MPVTARLSKQFNDRFGEQATNENELNFARFDAKVEQRFAQADATVARQFADLRVELIDRLDGQSKQLTRLMVALWTTLLIPIIGETSANLSSDGTRLRK